MNPDITVSDYADRWLDLIKASLKPSTVEGYAQRLRVHVRPAFGTLKVAQLHRGAIKAFLAEKLLSGLASDSVRLIHATIRAMLNAALDDGVILGNPANKLGKALRLIRPKATRQEGIKALDREQASRFLAAALVEAPRLYPLFLAMQRTGLRIGEALALKWDDLDLSAREIRVERAISNEGVIGTPKSGHGRTVDMSTTLRDVLQRHHATLAAAWLRRKPEKDENGQEKSKGEMPPWVFVGSGNSGTAIPEILALSLTP